MQHTPQDLYANLQLQAAQELVTLAQYELPLRRFLRTVGSALNRQTADRHEQTITAMNECYLITEGEQC